MNSRRAAMAVGSSLIAVFATGCIPRQGTPIAAPPPAPPDVAELCSSDPAIEMIALPGRGIDEPFLAAPALDGWERNHSRDSSLIRAGFVNRELRARRFAPAVIITLADVSEDSKTARQAIITEQGGVEGQPEVTDVAAQDGTVCGYPSRTLRYRYEGRDATTLLIAGTDRYGKTWVCTVGIQTADPDNPQFARDRAVLLENFQFVVQRDRNPTK